MLNGTEFLTLGAAMWKTREPKRKKGGT